MDYLVSHHDLRQLDKILVTVSDTHAANEAEVSISFEKK